MTIRDDILALSDAGHSVMTSTKFRDTLEFRDALNRLGLSQLGAARLFHANERSARRWALGERAVPETVAILLRLMIAGKITQDDVQNAGPPRKKMGQ